MAPATYSQFIRFLQEELAISTASIAFAERICGTFCLHSRELDYSTLPMVLWQYGFVTIDQLERIFDWQETTPTAYLNR
ncbi:DUF2949 domain-containing protein [Phormidium pseudopriestleyi FRX01]|uniref:DUF2949 domain-containing protein n=1 Tax=Phormidium pseudopriestleyi FRX01 TaxID=1759528 RepID=A0ABS3FNC8_9CYAN|nr:DUF2949 domain-containing protein [Phormidium pseudopriestleyi]MBO0348323.1 DUF2949 domain-containing protein [Phormidium pseudopriestleyi FRX01]